MTPFRDYICNTLDTVANACSSVMTVDEFSGFPADLSNYDVIVLGCPAAYPWLNNVEKDAIASWQQHWHRRLVLIGDVSYGDGLGYDSRLNEIVSRTGGPQFYTTTSRYLPTEYAHGWCYEKEGAVYDFNLDKPWLFTGVTRLRYDNPGWFSKDYGFWAAHIDTAYDYIMEYSHGYGDKLLGIHDCDVLSTDYAETSQYNFVFNFCTAFE